MLFLKYFLKLGASDHIVMAQIAERNILPDVVLHISNDTLIDSGIIFQIHKLADRYSHGRRRISPDHVDKGKAEIETDNGIYHLTSGQLIFHRPNEFHNLIAIGNTAPNIVVVSFECDSPCMKFFEKKLLKLSDSERNLMGMLIAEARRCIKTPLDDPYTEKMEKKEDFLFGSQQLIRIYLEQMLIYMIRRHGMNSKMYARN